MEHADELGGDIDDEFAMDGFGQLGMKIILAFGLAAALASAQYAPSASGSTTAAAEINSKTAVQLSSGAPTALNCTAGKDAAFDTVGLNFYDCTVSGTPGTWVRRESWSANLDSWSGKTPPSGTPVGTTDTQTLTGKTVDGVTPATMAFMDATSSVQTQLNAKQASLGFTALNAANNLSDVGSAGTSRTNLGLAIGSNVEGWSANLDTWSGKTPPSGTAVGTTDTQTLTGKTVDGVTPATMAFMDATSSVQAQLNAKLASAGFTQAAAAGLWTGSGCGTPTNSLLMSGNCSASTHVEPYIFRGLNQNTVAGWNVSLPGSNAPTLTSVEGASSGDVTTLTSAWNYSTLSFAANSTANTANSAQGTIPLVSTAVLSSGITLQLTWRTSAITGNALWQIQGQCVATGAVPGSFSASTALTASTAAGTTLQWTQTAVLTMTTSNALSGCAAGNIFMFRLYRDHQNASDTITATEELIQAVFGVTQ
jgi:hypothetical protein